MVKTIERIFQEGKMNFTELPQNVGDCPSVLVSALETAKIDPVKKELL